MASRRLLKKTIKSASIDLINECYLIQAFVPAVDKAKLADCISKIVKLNNEFVTRTNHLDGKEEKAIVKTYYNKLLADWAKSFGELLTEINNLAKTK